MRVLHLRAAAPPKDIRLVGQIALVELGVDVITRLLDRGVRDTHRVGAHVGDQADRALIAHLHAFVELLRRPHRTPRRKPQLFRGFLLDGAGREGRRRLPAALAGTDGRDDERQLFDFGDDVAGCLLGLDLRLVAVELLQPRLEWLAILFEIGRDRPVLLRDELPNLLFALDDEPQRDGLHPTGRQTGFDALPQHRGRLVADQSIEHPARLLGVDFALIDVHWVRERLSDGVLRDLVE